MTGRDVPQAGPDRTGDGPWDTDRLEGILAGVVAAETENEMGLDRLLDELRAPGTQNELRGAEAATAAFLRERESVLGVAAPVAKEKAALGLVPVAKEKAAVALLPVAKEKAVVVPLSSRRRRPVLVAGVAAASVTAAVLFAGTAAAAFTGSLPSSLQSVAHTLVGAPAPDADSDADTGTAVADGSHGTDAAPSSTRPTPSASDRGPSAGPSAPALAGLCQAFAGRASGDPATGSTAYAALAAAAAKAGLSVDAYCAANGRHGTPAPQASGHGKPTAPPGQSGQHRPTATPGHGNGNSQGSSNGNGHGNGKPNAPDRPGKPAAAGNPHPGAGNGSPAATH